MASNVTDEAAFEDAGLYDPSAPDAAERLALLSHLAGAGATIADMVAAEAAGQLVAAAADLSLFDVGTARSPAEVAEICGVSLAKVLRTRLATGLPAEEDVALPSWAPEDIAGFQLGAALFGEAPTLAFSRVMGASAARVAEAAVALFLTEVNSQLSAAGAPPVEWARANEEAAALVDVINSIQSHLLREHLHLAVRRQRASSGPGTGPEVTIAIGFVDLAGSTEWASSLALRTQADALARFESAAWDIATRHGGRIVKLIGDEVMFAASGAPAACDIALEVCAAVDADPSLPPARAAVGHGLVASRDGDYYGPLVHLVARAVKVAAEGRVVVTDEVRRLLAEAGSAHVACRFDHDGLRGIGEDVELFALGV